MNTQKQREKLRWRYRPFPELVRLSWPIVVQLLSFSVMTTVDTLFVGRLGASALAAVGIGGIAIFSVVAFAIGLYAGAKVRVSEAVGAGEHERTGPLLGAFLRIALPLGVLLFGAALLVAWTLPWISSDAQAGRLAQSYSSLRALAVPLIVLLTAIGQFRQALGDSQSAMRAALVANVINIPLNTWFIFGLGWGVDGAALASVGARVGELSFLLLIQQKQGFFVRRSSWAQSFRLFRFGLASGVERCLDVTAMAALVALLGRMGPVQVAAHHVALQLLHFSFLPLIALGEALSVLVGQAVGARERSLVRIVSLQTLALAVAYALLTGSVFGAFAEALLGIFTRDLEVLAAGADVMLAAIVLQFINSLYTVQKGVLRGLSDIRFVAVVAVGCAWLFTPPLTYVFGMLFGLGAAGGWWALCVEVCAGISLLTWRLSKHPAFALRGDPRPVWARLMARPGSR